MPSKKNSEIIAVKINHLLGYKAKRLKLEDISRVITNS